MAIGDQDDVFTRLKSYIPNWFNSLRPLFDAVLQGAARAWSFVYDLYAYAELQTRIRTSTDEFLDLEAHDYLGNTLQRRKDENDDTYRNRLLANLFPYPPTRAGMIKALENLTGRTPLIFEGDFSGGYLNRNAFLGHASYGFHLPYTAFIIVYRPQAKFSNAVYALNQNAFLNRTAFAYTRADFNILVSDADIYALINKVKVYATRMYVCILD